MLRYAVTIFLSAFLLFQVQPLIAKYILPWFGGTPAVWTTCMLFFQMLLLGGYFYAHVTTWRLSARGQAILHCSLLGLSLLFLPIIPGADWKPTSGDYPALRIILLLGVTVGIPYFLLSTTGPLLQKWFSRTHPNSATYRLYALSNVGSLLALLSYPFVFEPNFQLGFQAASWSWAYALFVILCGWCAWRAFRHAAAETSQAVTTPAAGDAAAASAEPVPAPGPLRILMWLALAAVPSVLLLATTSQMSQEVAVVPFLWVLPLSLYLLTFIICFESERWYIRGLWGLMLVVGTAVGTYAILQGITLDLVLQIVSYSILLFACCMACHGELARSKPHVRHLTLFYVMVATGGALGGLFVVAIAPYIFNKYLELHYGILAALFLTLVAWITDDDWSGYRRRTLRGRALSIGAALCLALYTLGLSRVLHLEGTGRGDYVTDNWDRLTLMIDNFEDLPTLRDDFREFWNDLGDIPEERGIIERTRTFYGVLTVEEGIDTNGDYYSLNHGRIQHGFQYLDPEMRTWKTSYYAPESGLGLSIDAHPWRLTPDGRDNPMHIGVIGLGTGSSAAYGRPGDRIRYYDINPEIKEIAYRHFFYCEDTPAEVTVVLGDARIKLEQELEEGAGQQFDVLAVDAFSSDAIPMHLLTKECFEIYFQHLKPDGILAVHISNRYLDLEPVVHGLASEAGWPALTVDYNNPEDDDAFSSCTWVLVTRNEEFINTPAMEYAVSAGPDEVDYLIWTDDYGSLWQVLRTDELEEKFHGVFARFGFAFGEGEDEE